MLVRVLAATLEYCEVKGCLPLAVLVLGYQPEMEAPALLNGSRPRDVGIEVVASLDSLPRAEGMHLLA